MSKIDSALKQSDPKTRQQLKEYFRNGMLPSENDFNDLIHSMVNMVDDGFAKDEEYGLKISTIEDGTRFLTLYTKKNPDQFVLFEYDESGGLKSLKMSATDIKKSSIDTDATNKKNDEHLPYGNLDKERDNPEHNSAFFFHLDGKLGIGKKSGNNLRLDVNGFAGMRGRIGTYQCGRGYKEPDKDKEKGRDIGYGRVPADKNWYPIITGLDQCHAFEIVARVGRAGSGKFAMLHAIAICTFGKSRNKIRKTSAYYGYFWNKINLRWRGETNNYRLEMRTNSNYKDRQGDVDIMYTVTSLWDDSLLVPDEYLKKEETTEADDRKKKNKRKRQAK